MESLDQRAGQFSGDPATLLAGPRELIQGLLPEHQVSILAGASGAGKSTLALQIVRDALTGGPVFGMPVSSPSLTVGYVVADRTSQDLRLTAQAVGCPLSFPVRSLVDDPSIDIGKFETQPLQVLFELLTSLKGCELIVVDPLIVFTGVDTNKYHLNAAKLIRINRFCMDAHITLLGTHHATKARTDYSFKRAQDRISGSSALLGYTSTQLFLATPEECDNEGGLFEWTIVSHHAAPRTLLLSRSDKGFTFIREETDSPTIPLEARIMGILAVGPCRPSDLLQATGASRSHLYRVLNGMEQGGVIIKLPHGHYRLAEKADHAES